MIQANTHTFQEVADAIAHHIVVTRTIGDAAYINLPLRYPGGSSVVVRITTAPSYAGEPNRFLVSDHALGYDEATMMGVGRIYVRQAGEIADRVGINFDDHAFVIEGASRDQLAGAVVAVANCSFEAVALVAQRVEDGKQEAESDFLYNRLVAVFTPQRVSRNVDVVGASNTTWHVGNQVESDHRRTIFEAVSSHHSSIYAANTKFRDIADLEDSPGRVAVVRKKAELTTLLAVLSQAARVIERDVRTDTFRHLAANGHDHPERLN